MLKMGKEIRKKLLKQQKDLNKAREKIYEPYINEEEQRKHIERLFYILKRRERRYLIELVIYIILLIANSGLFYHLMYGIGLTTFGTYIIGFVLLFPSIMLIINHKVD